MGSLATRPSFSESEAGQQRDTPVFGAGAGSGKLALPAAVIPKNTEDRGSIAICRGTVPVSKLQMHNSSIQRIMEKPIRNSFLGECIGDKGLIESPSTESGAH